MYESFSQYFATRLVVATAFATLAIADANRAAGAQAIIVQGNKTVDAETIRGLVNSTESPQPDELRQRLIATGLFSRVLVTRRDSQLVVSVTENVAVNRVAFEGNRKLKADQLRGQVQSKSGGPLTQLLIDADVQRLKDVYSRAGYGLASISGRINPLGNGRSDIVFTISEAEKTGIKSINFFGNKVFSSNQLRELMTSTESNFLSFIKTSDVYDPERFASDLEIIRRYYQKNGYVDFQLLSTNARFDQNAAGWIIDVSIQEGPQYKIGAIDIKSTLSGVAPADLERLLTTRSGDIYSAEAVEKSLMALSLEASRRGNPFVQVRPTGDRNSTSRVIGITYVIDDGPRVYVERVNIRGNTRTRDYVVRRELDFSEGDAYNKIQIDRAERRLNNLGFFTKVRLTNEPGSTPDRVVLNIHVEEKATGSFSIAGGYSTSDGIIGEVSLSEANFLGRGQFVRIAGTLGERTQGIDFSFTEPYFLGNRVAAGFDVFSKYSDLYSSNHYSSRVTGGQVRLTFPLTEEFSITPRYSLFTTEIKVPNSTDYPYNDCTNFIAGTTPGTSGADVETGNNNCLTNGEASVAVKEARGSTITSLIGLSLNYNSLDNVQRPRNGFVGELKPEYAGVGGESNFLRLSADARYYRELFDDVVGFVRVQGGHVQSTSGSLRMIDHYSLGSSLVRGFSSTGIGPRDVLTGNALGGTSYFGGTVEVQFPIYGLPRDVGLRGAIFADAGTLFNYDGGSKSITNPSFGSCPAGSSSRQFNVTTNSAYQSNVACVRDNNVFRSSVGVSLLWQSPLGPIRFDYAYALTKDEGTRDPASGIRYGGDKLQAFRFSGGTRF